MHIHTKYEVSILNPVARRAVHRCRRCQHQTMPMPDTNYARRTNHDYIGSFDRIPNEPKSTTVLLKALATIPDLYIFYK